MSIIHHYDKYCLHKSSSLRILLYRTFAVEILIMGGPIPLSTNNGHLLACIAVMCTIIVTLVFFVPTTASASSEELYKVVDDEKIGYSITSGNVTDVEVQNDPKEILLYVDSTKGKASLRVELPRELIDSKDENDTDVRYQVYFGASGPIGDNTSDPEGSANEPVVNNKNRTLQIEFPPEVKQILIKGSQMGGLDITDRIISLLIAVLIIVTVFYVSIVYFRKDKSERYYDIILDNSWYPSLAKFQFLIFTLISAFAFIWIYTLRLFGGFFDVQFIDIQSSIPWNLLLLMGISGGAYVVNKKISEMKYEHEKRPKKPHKFVTMLYEGNRKSLTRIQFFAWTWIGALVYLVILVLKAATTDLANLSIPDMPGVLVYLMGLGQGAYIGGKYVTLDSVFKEEEDQGTSEETTGNIDNQLGQISLSEGEVTKSITKTTDNVSEDSEELAKSVTTD
jgi:hypothetical protein